MTENVTIFKIEYQSDQSPNIINDKKWSAVYNFVVALDIHKTKQLKQCIQRTFFLKIFQSSLVHVIYLQIMVVLLYFKAIIF